MRNPRINITLNPSDLEIIEALCKKKMISVSSLAKKMIEDWLEDYEDRILAHRAEEAERKWIEDGSKTISHEELCQELGIESNIHRAQHKTSRSSRKTSKKESSEPSKKGLSSRRKKLAKH